MSSPTDRTGLAGYAAIALGTIFVSTLTLQKSAAAADVTYDGRVEQRFEYNDNRTLSAADEEETVGSITTPSFRARIETLRSRTLFEARLDFARFDESRFNYEDQRASFLTSYFGRRSEVGLGAEVSHLSTLESEETDTGLIDVSGRKLDISGTPYFSYDLTPRSQIRGSGFVRNVDYYDTLTLEDYQTYGASAGYFYALSEIDSLGTRFGYQHYRNEDRPGNTSDTYSALLVWNREITDRLASEIAAGPRYTEQEQAFGLVSDKTDSWGVSFSADVDWRATELLLLQLGLSHTVAPSGAGTTTERSIARFDGSYRTSELVSVRFRSYYQRDNRVDGGGGLDRDYFTAIPSLNWELSRNWEFATGYRYRWQQFEGSDSASSNMVFVSLSLKTTGWNLGMSPPVE